MRLMGTGDVLKHLRLQGLSVSERRLDFALRAGHLPEPSTRICGVRVWTDSDVEAVVAYFGQHAPGTRRRVGTGATRDHRSNE